MRIEPTIDSATVSDTTTATTVRSAARLAYDSDLAELQSASTDLYNIIVASESAATLEAYQLFHNTVMNRIPCNLSITVHGMTQYSDIRANLVKHASARILVAYDALVVRNAGNVKMLKKLRHTDLDDYHPHATLIGCIALALICAIGWGFYKFCAWFISL